MSSTKPMFTVFTGTWNRGSYLRRVYTSLCAQTMQDFEWLIVDDGSTDDTRERVDEMRAEGRLAIRYIYKENGGVHTAHNVAIRVASGEFFLRCDSDDAMVPEAIEKLYAVWQGIPEEFKDAYSGASCLCMDESGAIIGDRYPSDPWDSVPAVLSKLKGEKWGFHKTSILRAFPFPEFHQERHVPEGLIWSRMAAKYKTRCVNESLRIYHGTQGGLSGSVSRLRYTCGNGFSLFYREAMCRPGTLSQRLKHSANYTRTCLGMRRSVQNILDSSPQKVSTLFTLPLGFALYALDRMRGRTGDSA